MINLAVINLKDILKFLMKILVLIITILILMRFFSIIKFNKIKEAISKYSFIECMNSEIAIVNSKISTNNSNKNNILSSQLALFGYVEKETREYSQEIIESIVSPEEISSQSNEYQKVETQVVEENNIPAKITDSYNNVAIKNESDYTLTEDILKPDGTISNNKDIVIFHTHTCESYTPTKENDYEASGNYRTTDLNYSVARVGTELTNRLTEKGYNVIHDTTYHDYPAYNGSYTRALETVQNILSNNPKAEIVFDLHRDALGSNADYAPKVKIGDEYAAQIMFVIGTNGGGLYHPDWQKNLKLAVKIQEKAEEMYPGLFKQMIVTNSRYNQHVTTGASIIEVGATGNTLEECINSMKYFSIVLAEVLG